MKTALQLASLLFTWPLWVLAVVQLIARQHDEDIA